MGCGESKDDTDNNVSALPPSQAKESKKGSSAEAKKGYSAESKKASSSEAKKASSAEAKKGSSAEARKESSSVINESKKKQWVNNDEYKERLSRVQEDAYRAFREAPGHIRNSCSFISNMVDTAKDEENKKKQQWVNNEEYEEWLSRVQEDAYQAYREAPDHIRNDPRIALAAVQENFLAIQFVPTDILHNDKEIAAIRNDKATVISAIQQSYVFLRYASPELKNDKDVIIAAVQKNWHALKFAPPELRNDKDVVIAAVKNCGHALTYATPDLQNNKQVVMAAVERDGRAIGHASPEVQNDKEVVIAAVQRDGMALAHTSPEVQNDKEVVIAAIKNDPKALQFASPGIMQDKDVRAIAHKCWLSFVKKDETFLREAPDYIRGDKEFMLVALQEEESIGGSALEYATPELQNDREVVMAAVQKSGRAIKHASPALRNDKDIVLVAVQQDRFVLRYVSPTLQEDKDVALAAVKQNPDAIRVVQGDLKRDQDILIAAGMFDESHEATKTKEDDDTDNNINVRKVVLSTRFSLNKTSHSQATNFTKLLKDHTYIQQGGRFKFYAPNAFDKKTCDPEWTRFDWPCRGTNDTCRYNKNVLTKDGRPTDDCCWRYSFRYQLEEAKDTGGFMLQLIEKDDWNSDRPKLGNGQNIELDMAQSDELQMKVFHVYRPMDKYGYEFSFKDCHVDEVVSAIKCWYDNDCKDVSLCVVHPSYSYC